LILRRVVPLGALLVVAASCGDLTGPVSPSTPVNVKATLVNATTVNVTWDPSPQNDGVVSYNVFRNGTKVGESTTTSFTDTGLAQQVTYKYTVSANCTSGVLSEQSAETPEATVTTLDITPPRVTAVSPLNGATGVSLAGSSRVTFSEPIDPATLTTSTYNLRLTSTGEIIAGTIVYNATARTAEYIPTDHLPNASSVTVTVTAGVKDFAGNALSPVFTSTFTTRDEVGPTVVATSPANGATGVPTSSAVTITFSEAVDASTVSATTITMRVTTSGAAVAGTVGYNATTHVATFTPSAPLTQNTSYTVTVSGSIRDPAGNVMGSDFVFTFSTGDTTPPTVISTAPGNLATNVPTSTTVTATFSEAMDPATINSTTFTLRVTATSTGVAGVVSYNAATNTATFTPSTSLLPGTTYTARITTGAKDLAGNALASQFEWTFITGAAPTVTSVAPPNNATNVSTASIITLTFSEPMDPTTINTTTIRLATTGSATPVTGTVAYTAGSTTATFTPTGPLAGATSYTVTVTTGARSSFGVPLASQFTSQFTTTAAVDNTAPTVVATSPVNGTTTSAVSGPFTVTFSEAMNQTTLTAGSGGTGGTLQLLAGASLTPVPINVSYTAATNTANIAPLSPLTNGTQYTLRVTTGVKDLAGNALASTFNSTFTVDTSPPTVTANTPANLATGVATSTTVTVTFSEVMDASTIISPATNVRLVITAGSVAVGGTVSYNAATRVATFTPSSALLPSTNYTATVTTGVKDAAGNALASDFVFTFTTAP
jgi:methionine-rich copper-binding protein CopC